jgi:hypothetical protein
MRKLFALAMLVALTLGIMAPGLAQAQSGTPGTEATGSFGVPLGTAVPIVGPDGSPIGTITVTNITDPFTGFDASSAPQRGYHYALAEVTISNTGTSPMEIYPNYIMGIDNEGFITDQPYITYTDPSVVQLEYTEALAPGASVTGVIPYQLFGTTTLERIVYSPTYDLMITALDVRPAPVALGTPVTVLDATGAPMAEVTVNGVTDPFTGYDSFSAPQRGTRYVLLDVTVTNTGTSVLSTTPSDFWVVDADGFVLSSAFASRTDQTLPDFDYLDLNPGESQQGALVYEVFGNIPVTQVSWGDGYDALSVVADLTSGTGTSQPVSQPPAATEVTGAPTVAALPTVATTTGATTGSADCAGLVDWGLDLLDRILRAGELTAVLQTADVSTMSAAQITDIASQLRTMGDEQAASNPPAAAAELNSIMADQFYYPLADAMDEIAAALASGNTAGALTAMQSVQAVNAVFADGGAYDVAADALTLACPAETQELNAAAA